MEYLVLYTHQKTKKAKTWHDGVLSVTTANKAVLYDDKKTKLDSMYIKPEAIVKGEQLESDRYFILIEEEKSTVQTIVEPVKLVTCPIRVPVRTGLKRKRTGFVPPRLVKQPENEGNQLVPHEPSSGETYLELLRKKRASFQNGSANNSDKYCFNSAPHNTETPLLQAPSRQQSFSENFNSIPKISEQTLDYKILSDENASAQSNQFSPWSSYGNKLKSLHSPGKSFLSPGKSLNSPGTSQQICSEINVENFVKEASPSMDDNNKCLQSPDHTNICLPTKNLISENINFIKNDTIITNVNKYEKSASGGLKLCNETTSEDQNCKRSMTQIMALLGKKKSSPSTLSHDMEINNGMNKSTTSTLSHVMELNKEEVKYSNSNNIKNQSNNLYCEEKKDFSDNIIKEEHRKNQIERLELDHTEITISKMSPIYNEQVSTEEQDSIQCLNDSVRSSQEWSSVKIELSPLTPNVILENQERTGKEMAYELKDEIYLNNVDFSTYSKQVTQDDSKAGILSNNSSEVLSPFHKSSEVPLNNKLPPKTTLQGCIQTKSSPDEQNKRQDILHGSSELDKNDLFTMDDEHMLDVNDDLAVSFDINFSPLSNVFDSDSAEGQSTVGNTTDLSQPETTVVDNNGDYSKLENNSSNVCEINNPIEINMKEQFIDKKSETFQLTEDSFDDSDKNSNPAESGENTNMTPNGCSPKYTENTDINIDDKVINKSYLSSSNDDQLKSHFESTVTNNIIYDSIDIQEYSNSIEGNLSIHHSVDSDMKQEDTKSATIIEDVAESSIDITKLDDNTVLSPKEQGLFKSLNVKDPDNNERISCYFSKDLQMDKQSLTDSQCQLDNYNNESEFESQFENENQLKHSRKEGKYEMLESENFIRADNSQTCRNNFIRENFSSESKNFMNEDYSPDYSENFVNGDYRESSARGYYFADCNSERKDFSPEETCSMNKMNKMEPSVQGQSDHILQHPDDIFAKKNQMMIRPNHEGSEDIPINCQIQNQSDLRCTASEKLESYIMRGSITSGAVRRKDGNVREPMAEDESFYIDLNDDKPRLKSQQMSSVMFQFQSSPAQFVPNTPEFLKSLKTRGSSQNSSGKSSQEELVVSGDTDYLDYDNLSESDKSHRYLTYSNQILKRGSLQQIVENENHFLKSTVSQQRKVKIPLVSAPEDSLTENGDNNSVSRSKSHDEGEKPALFDRKLIQDRSDVDNGCNNVVEAPNSSESDMSSPSLTYWENKLIQRHKCEPSATQR
ncbi:uncharacterized protein LOC143046874 [Mytilus galloprovincialis]|uniref:uncharacterized protein LOC143046874 n=1 Tax=Mytilus galloprovincialis TaxID=29158 RepID=UPI003F7B9A62